jgi:hypothetical protein
VWVHRVHPRGHRGGTTSTLIPTTQEPRITRVRPPVCLSDVYSYVWVGRGLLLCAVGSGSIHENFTDTSLTLGGSAYARLSPVLCCCCVHIVLQWCDAPVSVRVAAPALPLVPYRVGSGGGTPLDRPLPPRPHQDHRQTHRTGDISTHCMSFVGG